MKKLGGNGGWSSATERISGAWFSLFYKIQSSDWIFQTQGKQKHCEPSSENKFLQKMLPSVDFTLCNKNVTSECFLRQAIGTFEVIKALKTVFQVATTTIISDTILFVVWNNRTLYPSDKW